MRSEKSKIDERHRKELLRFLLVKTAAVRRGVKPGELLRVRHCYAGVNEDGLRVCLYRSDIYDILGLDYVELKVETESSLVLFYNPSALTKTLADRRNGKWLARLGYPANGSMQDLLDALCHRASECELPHEVGIFIGYPLKDVAGFMRRIPDTPVHNGAWRVYGGPKESLARMKLYASVEAAAHKAFLRASGIDDFINVVSLNGVI